MENLKKKYEQEQYTLKQLWNALNPKLYDDVSCLVIKEVLFLILTPYEDMNTRIKFLKEIIELVSKMETEFEQ